MSFKRSLETFQYWKNNRYVDRDTVDNIREFLCDVYDKDERQFYDAYNRMVEKQEMADAA